MKIRGGEEAELLGGGRVESGIGIAEGCLSKLVSSQALDGR